MKGLLCQNCQRFFPGDFAACPDAHCAPPPKAAWAECASKAPPVEQSQESMRSIIRSKPPIVIESCEHRNNMTIMLCIVAICSLFALFVVYVTAPYKGRSNAVEISSWMEAVHLVSDNKQYEAQLASNGNLVVRDLALSSRPTIWSSNTTTSKPVIRFAYGHITVHGLGPDTDYTFSTPGKILYLDNDGQLHTLLLEKKCPKGAQGPTAKGESDNPWNTSGPGTPDGELKIGGIDFGSGTNVYRSGSAANQKTLTEHSHLASRMTDECLGAIAIGGDGPGYQAAIGGVAIGHYPAFDPPQQAGPDCVLLPESHVKYGQFTLESHGYRAVNQPDGNLVVYDAKGAAIWASHTQGKRPSIWRDSEGRWFVGEGKHLSPLNNEANAFCLGVLGLFYTKRIDLQPPTREQDCVPIKPGEPVKEFELFSRNGAYHVTYANNGLRTVPIPLRVDGQLLSDIYFPEFTLTEDGNTVQFGRLSMHTTIKPDRICLSDAGHLYLHNSQTKQGQTFLTR